VETLMNTVYLDSGLASGTDTESSLCYDLVLSLVLFSCFL